MAGNANHKRAEQQRGNDRLDQVQEDLADDVQLDGSSRKVVAEFGTGQHGDKDPGCQGPPPESINKDHGQDQQPGQDPDQARDRYDPVMMKQMKDCGKRY